MSEPTDREGRGGTPRMPEIIRRLMSQVDELRDDKLRETVVSELLRKAIHKGNEVVDSTEDSVRRWVTDLPLPKEVVDRLTVRIDDYKTEALRMIKDELHEFLDRVDIGHEIQKVLTSLSFEITTEVRFIPNEKRVGSERGAGTGVKPEVKTATRVRRKRSRGDTEPPSEDT